MFKIGTPIVYFKTFMKKHLLFPTEVYTDNIILEIPTMINFLYNTRKKHEGVKRSNKGGWHSLPNIYEFNEIIPLCHYICSQVSKIYKKNTQIVSMWGNISSKFHYNVIHSHGKIPNTLSGVYYLQTNKNSGCLTLHNEGNIDISKNYYPKSGDLIIFPNSTPHSVGINLSNEDRISIAFNITIN